MNYFRSKTLGSLVPQRLPTSHSSLVPSHCSYHLGVCFNVTSRMTERHGVMSQSRHLLQSRWEFASISEINGLEAPGKCRKDTYHVGVLCSVVSGGQNSHPSIGDMGCHVHRAQLGREMKGTWGNCLCGEGWRHWVIQTFLRVEQKKSCQRENGDSLF